MLYSAVTHATLPTYAAASTIITHAPPAYARTARATTAATWRTVVTARRDAGFSADKQRARHRVCNWSVNDVTFGDATRGSFAVVALASLGRTARLVYMFGSVDDCTFDRCWHRTSTVCHWQATFERMRVDDVRW